MEERELKISFGKSGNGGRVTRLTIPIKWIDGMEITPEERNVLVSYNEETQEIIIRKKTTSD